VPTVDSKEKIYHAQSDRLTVTDTRTTP